MIQDVEEHGIIEFEPKFEGRQIVMIIAPKAK
jgi:translation initiation factor IF-3